MFPSNQAVSSGPRLAVLGGGIAGLSAAFWLTELMPSASITLHEAADTLGGQVRTRREGPYLFESGPIAFPTAAPATSSLLRAAGISGLCVATRTGGGLGVWDGRRVIPLPRNAIQFLLRRLVKPSGLFRLLAEPFIPRGRKDEDVSVREFFRRRTGPEFFASLMEPVAAALLAGNPDRMSMSANLPRYHAMEQEAGSLALGFLKGRFRRRPPVSGPRLPSAATTAEGCGGFARALGEALARRGVDIRLASSATTIGYDGRVHLLRTQRRGVKALESYDGLIAALPAPDLAAVETGWPVEMRDFLQGIHHAPLSLLHLAFPADRLGGSFRGEGVLAQPRAGEDFLSCFLPSRLAAGRGPDGHELFRVLAGGARNPGIANLGDDEFASRMVDAVRRVFSAEGDPEVLLRVRHARGLPQIEVGHAKRLAKAAAWLARERPGLLLAGTSYRGAGIENAAAAGRAAAETAALHFTRAAQNADAGKAYHG